MKNKIFLCIALLWMVCQRPAQAATQPTVPGCPYIAVPADGFVMEGNHHLPSLTIWPRAFAQVQSGCVYVWLGTRLHSIARLNEAKVVDGVIDDLVEGVFDDSDLPPMVYCKAQDRPAKGDCGRFRTLWLDEFPELVADVTKRGAH